MTETITLPIKKVNGERWAEISAHGASVTHFICGERVDQASDLSFAGGHRVRLYKFKKNVHWKIPVGIELDIADLAPAQAPRRQGRR
jgi:hypothetical protein